MDNSGRKVSSPSSASRPDVAAPNVRRGWAGRLRQRASPFQREQVLNEPASGPTLRNPTRRPSHAPGRSASGSIYVPAPLRPSARTERPELGSRAQRTAGASVYRGRQTDLTRRWSRARTTSTSPRCSRTLRPLPLHPLPNRAEMVLRRTQGHLTLPEVVLGPREPPVHLRVGRWGHQGSRGHLHARRILTRAQTHRSPRCGVSLHFERWGNGRFPRRWVSPCGMPTSLHPSADRAMRRSSSDGPSLIGRRSPA
jgi:hypothetical protein